MDRQPACARRLALALALCSSPLMAGDVQPTGAKAPAAARFDISQAFGAQWVDGDLWAGGPGFKARFEADGVEFTPALGPAAPRNLPLGLSARSVSRGDTLLWSDESSPPTTPTLAGNVVSYARQPGLTERYEVRSTGLEQSFVLDALPAGEGDLVVRLALDTTLAAQPDGAGWRFASEFGGVRYGAVTGVDASGRRVAGDVRVLSTSVGSELLLTLPASFVATADYPLVLDPEITPAFLLLVNTSTDQESPDVSYDGGVQRWLATWSEVFSLFDADIRAQTFLDDGTKVASGFWFVDTSSDTVCRHPSVASLQGYGRWFIAYTRQPTFGFAGDVYGCSISSTLGKSNTLLIAGTAADEFHADVGGHSGNSPVVSVVWEAAGSVLHQNVWLANDPTITLYLGTKTLASGTASRPRIASSSGDLQFLLVVCTTLVATPAPGHHDILAIMIDDLGYAVDAWPIVVTPGVDERTPDVDGDGVTWVVAWSWASTISGTVNSVRALRVYSPGATILEGPTLDVAQGSNNIEPSVADTGHGYLVAFAKQIAGSNYDIAVVGVDQSVTHVNDPLKYADATTTQAHEPRLGARHVSHLSASDGAFLVWESLDSTTGNGDAFGSLVEPSTGNVTNLGGGSSWGANLSTTSPKVGGPFEHHYHGLYPGNPVTMVISLLHLGAPLCKGTLHVHPDVAIYLSLLTDGNAMVTLNTPIPPDATLLGLTFYEQWVEKDMLTSPCGKHIQLSNGLALTIE